MVWTSVRLGAVESGKVRCGMVRYGSWLGKVRLGMVRLGTVWTLARLGTAGFGQVWYGMDPCSV